MSEPASGRPAHDLPNNDNEVCAPRVVMAFAAISAERRLAQVSTWSEVAGDDMREFMEAGVLTLGYAAPIVAADFEPTRVVVGTTDSQATHNAYQRCVSWKGAHEPVHPLNGVNVDGTCAETYTAPLKDKRCSGELARGQASSPLGAVRRVLQLRHERLHG